MEKTYYQKWQQEKFGNVLTETEPDEASKETDAERFKEVFIEVMEREQQNQNH